MRTEDHVRDWLTPGEMATRLALSKQKTFSILASGEVDAIKIGRSVRVSARSLSEFIRRNPYIRDEGADS